MANSRFSYVRSFELPDALLPRCWIVIRIDGKGFTKCVRACMRVCMTLRRRGASPFVLATAPLTCLLLRRPPWARFTDAHGFTKPVDDRGIALMNDAAKVRPCDKGREESHCSHIGCSLPLDLPLRR